MLRSFLLFLSKATWAQSLITRWKFSWRAASRFVAGTQIEDAIKVVKELNSKGINATIDHLGESTSNRDDATEATKEVLALLDAIDYQEVRTNISVKLTQIGLSIDDECCEENLEEIIHCARKTRNFVRIDMEDSPYTKRTIGLYRLMKKRGYKNVGLVVQSYLYRSEKDVQDLLTEGTRFRLVKGAYKEPAHLAFPKKVVVDHNFDLLTRIIIDYAVMSDQSAISEDGRIPPILALGTHDSRRIRLAKDYAQKVGLPKSSLEFQMLYGIRRDIQKECVQEGYPVRVYVPYGTHWYPFFMRRLAERPANLFFFLGNIFRK